MAKFSKVYFKDKGKALMMTGAEVAVVGGSMLVTKKFLDFNTLFKKSIEKDPKFASKWWMKHQGGLKTVVGIGAAIMVKNPWLRLIAIGFALCGFIEEVRVISTDDKGVSFFDAIGNRTSGASKISDEALYEAAKKRTNGAGATNPTNEFPTNVGYTGATNPTNEFPTNVGYHNEFTDVLNPSNIATVGFQYNTGYQY